jgi:hypothetical protein
MDIDTIQSYVTLIKDIITGLSALVAASIAILGLQAWKKQLKGKTEYELAQRLLRAIYKVREALAVVRNPFQSAAEIAAAMKESSIEGDIINNPTIRAQSERAVYEKRWQKVQEAFVDVESTLLEAEAIWGQPVKDSVKPLQDCISTLAINIKKHLRNIEKQPRNFDSQEEEKIDDIIYGFSGDSDNNLFSKEINTAVSKMESFLRPRLKI